MKQPYTLPGIDFSRKDDECQIDFANPQKQMAKLFFGAKPDAAMITKLIATTDSERFTFTLAQADGPFYYQIQLADQASPIFGERLLPLKGAINVRDMGGFRTEDGHSLRWDMLYRGDQLSKLEADDIDYLEKIGFHSIIDFRSDEEQRLNPNARLSTIKNYYSCDPHSTVSEAAGAVVSFEEENRLIVKNLESGAVPPAELNGSGIIFHKNYREFVTSPKAQASFTKMLRALLLEENTPAFMHCRGGKDRTGFGAALTLGVLGVNLEDIMTDYMITQEVRKERTRLKMGLYAEHTDNQDVLAYLLAMIDTRTDYLQASFDAIFEKYATIADYAHGELGITHEEIQQLQELYLEKSE